MKYALDRFEQEVRAAIAATGKLSADQIELTTPKPNIPADLAFPVFRAAKEQGVAPPALAQALATAIDLAALPLVERVTAIGPFLNFTIKSTQFTAEVLDEVQRLGVRYGHDDRGSDKTVLVEYSAPNMARRMHVAHIRSTIIGQSLFNIFAALGYHAISDNHLGDWGKNFGVLITAIQHEGQPAGDGEAPLAALEQLYAKYTTLTKEDPALDQEARDWSLKLEQGEARARELWEWIVQLTLRINQPLYDRLGARFDTMYGESFYEDKMAPVIHKALDEGIAFRDESGALVVDLPGLPTFLLQRSDQGTLYHTRDVATVIFREQAYHPVKIIYVVDARQELHFRQLFALVRALGYASEIELVHISFGTVFGPDGQPLAARRGNMIYLKALLDEAHDRARAVVDRASPELAEHERDEVAEIVGVGAVIYNDLYQDPRRNITVDWDRMMALEGNSAPYIQYMYARCRSIIRKAQDDGADALTAYDPRVLLHPAEVTVVKQLAKLPLAVREAGARYAPFVIAEWCYETARALSGFYRDCQVLKAETPALRMARLHLVAATAQALQNGLALLGLRAPERM
jgi:arginyl-tRNA synthetase